MAVFRKYIQKIKDIHYFEELLVNNDPNILSILFVLRMDGLNVFSKKWTPNLLTVVHCATVAFFWTLIVVNFIRACSNGNLQFPLDLDFVYVIGGITSGVMQTYILVANKKELRDVYRWVLVDFYTWYDCAEEELVAYRRKASKMSKWVTYTGVQMYAAVFMMMVKPLVDGSGLPLIGRLVHIQGLDYSQTIQHVVMYAWELVLMINVTNLLYTTDSVAIVMLTQLAAHLRRVGDELHQAGNSHDVRSLDGALPLFVERYNAIQKCLDTLTGVYRIQNLTLPIYIIIFSSVTMLAFDGTLATVHCLALAVAHTFRLLNFCLPAELVLQESELLHRKLMWSGWEEWPLRQQRSLLFMLKRLQRPMGMRCGLRGFFSLLQYSSTMQTIYSIYNAFKRFKK